jgi:hypothetical protein
MPGICVGVVENIIEPDATQKMLFVEAPFIKIIFATLINRIELFNTKKNCPEGLFSASNVIVIGPPELRPKLRVELLTYLPGIYVTSEKLLEMEEVVGLLCMAAINAVSSVPVCDVGVLCVPIKFPLGSIDEPYDPGPIVVVFGADGANNILFGDTTANRFKLE